jgi:hypothetical protein
VATMAKIDHVHSLEGGWCPLCGAICNYDADGEPFEWEKDGVKTPATAENTDFSHEVCVRFR